MAILGQVLGFMIGIALFSVVAIIFERRSVVKLQPYDYTQGQLIALSAAMKLANGLSDDLTERETASLISEYCRHATDSPDCTYIIRPSAAAFSLD